MNINLRDDAYHPRVAAHSARIRPSRSRGPISGIALLLSWVCSAVLIVGLEPPVLTLAGLLLSLILPGLLAADLIIGGSSTSLELWVVITLSMSLAITLALGAFGATVTDLSTTTLGWSWLAVSSLVGGASLMAGAMSGPSDLTR